MAEGIAIMTRDRDAFDFFDEGRRERSRFGDNEQRESESQVTKSNLCDLDLFCHSDNATKLAIAVSTNTKTPFMKWIWLPRSLIEYVHTGAVRNVAIVRVTLPEKLAKEKGLV
jgi:hypothetical protein